MTHLLTYTNSTGQTVTAVSVTSGGDRVKVVEFTGSQLKIQAKETVDVEGLDYGAVNFRFEVTGTPTYYSVGTSISIDQTLYSLVGSTVGSSYDFESGITASLGNLIKGSFGQALPSLSDSQTTTAQLLVKAALSSGPLNTTLQMSIADVLSETENTNNRSRKFGATLDTTWKEPGVNQENVTVNLSLTPQRIITVSR